MKRPRQPRRGNLSAWEAWIDVPVADGIARQPREWRRAAAWLRRVADWWEYLADEQEMKQQRPWRRLWVCEAKEEGR